MKLFSLILSRLAFFPFLLALVNFLCFAYAHSALQVQRSLNPWGTGGDASSDFLRLYSIYVAKFLKLEIGMMPAGGETILQSLSQAVINSLGLFLIAVIVSSVIGLLVGINSVKTNPPGIHKWLTPLTTLGLAAPSFFIASLLLVAILFYTSLTARGSPLPIPISGLKGKYPSKTPILLAARCAKAGFMTQPVMVFCSLTMKISDPLSL